MQRIPTAVQPSRLVWFAGWVLAALGANAQPTLPPHETEPVTRASELLPPAVIRAANYRVTDRVDLTGDLYTFEIESDYGLYRVQSLAMLEIRTAELKTLGQAIGQFKLSNLAFAEQLRGQLSVDASSIVDVVTAPFDMASQFAGNLTQTAKELAEFPGDGVTLDDDRYVDAVTLDAVTGAHKRNVAYQLGLDVYSSNPKVQEFLNAVATARSQGHFSAGTVTLRLPPSPIVQVADGRLDAEVKKLLQSLTPAQLDEGVDEQLASMGIEAEDRQYFIAQPSFSPRHRTTITAHLDFLRGTENRGVLVRAARSARGEADALAYEMLSRMLARYHETVGAIRELRFVGGLATAVTASNRALVMLPVDVIYWSAETEQRLEALRQRLSMAGFPEQELILTGALTESARRGLEGFGFAYREKFLAAAR